MNDESPTRVGDYEILGVLGAGGMGKVFKVRNVITDRVEAMKVLLPDLAGRRELADRFLREIKLLAGLNHPNIAALRTALTWDNQLVMVMEYVEGVTLAARLKQGPIATADAVNYICQVLSALDYAHRLHIIHRDIKPANMMLTPDGTVKLMDFGIARSQSDPVLTAAGSTMGSLHYMSPEQVKGENVDERSDLYSVGVSLYELATGQRPFQADNDYAVMAAQLQQSPAPPRTLRPDLPAALNEIILMSMNKEPLQRFQTAEAFRTALNNIPADALPAEAGVQSTATSYGGMVNGATVTAATPPNAAIRAVRGSQERPALAAAPVAVAPAASTPKPAKTQAASPVAATAQPQTPTPSVAAPPQTVAKAAGHRGLYVSLGALIVLAVLIAAGLYLPRLNRTHASSATPAASQPASPPAAPPATNNPQPAASSNADTSPKPESPPAPTSEPTTSAANRSPASAPTAAPLRTTPPPKKRAAAASAGGEAPRQEQRAAISPAEAGNASPASASVGQLQQLEHDFDLLTSRAEAVNASLDTLRQGQAGQGLGLRADVVSSQGRMRTYMARVQSALKDRDAEGAKKYLNLAESEVANLEKFLGH